MMGSEAEETVMARAFAAVLRKCPECGRVFNLDRVADADEWAYGHDCEVKDGTDD